MSFSVCNTQAPPQARICCKSNIMQRLTCYTPASHTVDTGQCSLLVRPDLPQARVVTSADLARLPMGAIIDRVEYVAVKGTLVMKTEFNLGLGQLNGPIMLSLIEGGTSDIANEGIGGTFDVVCDNISGANTKPVVTETLVNLVTRNPGPGAISGGTLRVDVYYHSR